MNAQKPKVPITPEDNKTANKLCLLSIVCEIGSVILFIILITLVDAFVDQETAFYNALASGATSFIGLVQLTGLVLMIYVRVKYPQNVFGKVLMWLYIVAIVIIVIVIVVVFVACTIICKSCMGIGG